MSLFLERCLRGREFWGIVRIYQCLGTPEICLGT